MTGFNDRFGGSGLTPSDVTLAQYTLVANLLTYWPAFANPLNVLARQLDVTAQQAGFAISLPDATLGSPGRNTMFRNLGIYPFIVTNFVGATIYTIPPGQVINIYLTDNTTQAGQWGAFILGSGVSSLDLSNAAGNGLFVSGSKLTVAPISSATSGNRTMSVQDCATAFVWTGGAGTFTLPLSSTVGQFFFEVRNQGSGALTLAASGSELIDSSASITLQINESCFVHAGIGYWYSVGRGRATQFAFTQLQKSVTGGTTTLTLTEAANVVQTYTGVLTSNETVVLPAVVQVYYISNATTGAFNFLVKAPGAGTTVAIPTSQNAVLFCDGTNVINASTTTSGVTGLVLGSGTALTPSMGIGASNTGIFSSGSNQVSIASNSVKVADFGTTGLTINAPSSLFTINSPSGNAARGMIRTVGNYAIDSYYTGANLRWSYGVDNSAESGSNAGSNWFLQTYNDAGAPLATPFSVSRATGIVSMPNGVVANVTGNLTGTASNASNAANATSAANATHANSSGQLDGGYTPVSFMTRGTGNSFTCHWNGSILYFGVDGNVFGGTMPMNISGNAATASITSNLNGITGWAYSAVGGTPIYAWSTNGSGASQFLTQPSQWSVNFANSSNTCNTAGNANALGGIGAGGWIQNGASVISLTNSGFTAMFANVAGTSCFWGMSISDESLKENITATEEDSLGKINRISFKGYNFKRLTTKPKDQKGNVIEDAEPIQIDDGHRHKLGGLAGDFEAIDPEWVTTVEGGIEGQHKQPNLYPMLMAAMHAIQQLSAEVDSLKAQVKGAQ